MLSTWSCESDIIPISIFLIINFNLKNALFETLMYAKLLFVASLFFISFLPMGYTLQVSEIMQNPAGSDGNREWIEIHNNDSGAHNLTGWKINTDNADHSLNAPPTNGGQGSVIIPPGSFAVISQDASSFLADYPGYNGTVIDSSWSDLSNSLNKTIWLKNSSVVFDNITYSPVSEGNTSCRVGDFVECIPTPGAANVVSNLTVDKMDAVISVIVENMTVNNSYQLFQINIAGKACSATDNITVSYNITPGISSDLTSEIGCSAQIASWTPTTSGNYTLCGRVSGLDEADYTNNEICKTVYASNAPLLACDLSLSVASESIINASQSFDYSIFVNDSSCNQTSHSIEIEYWIEDLFGVYVKDKLNTTQSIICSKSVSRQWTPGGISGTEAYNIVARLVSHGCGDMNSANDAGEKIIVAKGTSQSDSSLAITSVDAGPVRYK